jgi:hypothetical protein
MRSSSSILRKLTAVYDSVLNSGLEDGLRNLILDGLEDLRRAIHEYRIRGMVGIDAAMAKNVVNAVMTQDAEDTPGKPLAMFRDFVREAAAIATVTHYVYPQLIELINKVKLLGH